MSTSVQTGDIPRWLAASASEQVLLFYLEGELDTADGFTQAFIDDRELSRVQFEL